MGSLRDADGRNGLAGSQVFQAPEATKETTFHVRRQAAGGYTTVPFVATDRCGTWTSFVGGGPSAGF